tara:strand:+ start:928 stop:1947 length:1020 start_codon:yes stop_codon:yes gene_type:complete
LIRIIITSAGGKLIPSLTKFLKNDKQLQGLYIVGIDKKKFKKNTYLDKKYLINEIREKNYIIKLLEICKKEKINLVIPYSDFEARVIAKFKNKLTKIGIKVLVNDSKIIKLISNKYLTYNILKREGVSVPKYKLAKNLPVLKRVLNEFNYPQIGVVIKPISSLGGRGVIILKGKKDKLERWIGKGKRETLFAKEKKLFSDKVFQYGPVMVMEILKSPAYDVDLFSFKKKNFFIIRKRINPSGIPYKGNIILKNKEIENYCKKISKILNIKFLVDIDLLTSSQTNKPVLLEINPRPSGSLVATYFVNAPLFSLAIAKILKKKYFFDYSKVKSNKCIKLIN